MSKKTNSCIYHFENYYWNAKNKLYLKKNQDIMGSKQNGVLEFAARPGYACVFHCYS